MHNYECVDIIADVAAFYPQTRDVVTLANSYYLLLMEFETRVVRAAFMQLAKDPANRCFPGPGKVYELCRTLSRQPAARRKQSSAIAVPDKVADWLAAIRADRDWLAATADERTERLARHFFPERDAAFCQANFLELDYIRSLDDCCAGCDGVICRREFSQGWFAAPQLAPDGGYVTVVMQHCRDLLVRI